MQQIQGWLDKKSIFKLWIKKYVTLSNYQLSIYKDSTSSTPESEYELDMQTTIETNSSNSCQFKIRIQNPKPTTITMKASSKDQMVDWVLHLRRSSYSNKTVLTRMFNIISVIESSFYGKIYLCSKKNSNEILVIKTFKKKRITKSNKVFSIKNEKNILSLIHSPFIIDLKYAFQTSKKYFLAIEYVPGGNLYHHLKERKICVNDVKLYIAELSIAINELHKNGIIHRDLKPENVMIAKDGHVKLIDFGLSTFCDENQKLKNMCGTAEYIAPEVILGIGYDCRIDWWSLGILTYELLYKSTPFFGLNNQYIYQSILKKDPVFPKNEDNEIVSFISELLQKDPDKRGGYNFIQSSEFMDDIDFKSVFEKKISPSFIPVVADFDSASKRSFSSDSDAEMNQSNDANGIDDFAYNYIHDSLYAEDKS